MVCLIYQKLLTKQGHTQMDTPSEIAENAYYESLETSGAPSCHLCGKTERETPLLWCGSRHCNNSICTGCATPVQYKLEACSDECAELIADDMVAREATLRHQVYRLRRQVAKASAITSAKVAACGVLRESDETERQVA